MDEIRPLSDISVDSFLQSLQSGFMGGEPYSGKTLKRYAGIVLDFVGYARSEGILNLDEVNSAWLRKFLFQPATFEQKSGRRRKSSELRFSASTRIVIQSALSVFWLWAQENRFALDNPIEAIERERIEDRKRLKRGGRTPSRLPSVLTWEQQERLIDLVMANPRIESGARDLAMVQFLMETGLRCEEMCELPLSALDTVSGRLRVIGKGNKERQVVFDPSEVKDGMNLWLPIRSEIADRIGRQCYSALFLTRNGRKLTPQGVYQQISRYLRLLEQELNETAGKSKAIIPHYGPHVLRHTAASRMLAYGKSVIEAMTNLGHSDMSTFQIYAHLLPSRRKEPS